VRVVISPDEVVATFTGSVREHVVFVERIRLAHFGFGRMDLAEQLAVVLKKERAWKRGLAALTTPEAFATTTLETMVNEVFLQQHQVATLDLHLE